MRLSISFGILSVLVGFTFFGTQLFASGGHKARDIVYTPTPDAPKTQTLAQQINKSKGCMSCHTEVDSKSMHESPGVILGCTDCHGGDSTVFVPQGTQQGDESYDAALDQAHVQPLYPEDWNYPSSANPERSYALLNRESPEFVRFVNPGDLRVAEETCGACHMATVQAAKRSIMATGAMLWGGGSYNNGILPFKNYILGEAYTREGEPAKIQGIPFRKDEAEWVAKKHGVLGSLLPLPAWETFRQGDIFRVFERGGRNITNLFPETAIPNALGQLQRLEEPGRPDLKQSNRGPGTGGRIAVPLINITKTRLNDPLMWFLGTNEQAGDYRSSGCSACHVVYANDRTPAHSGHYAKFGHRGKTQTIDPTIDKNEAGHPLQHSFTRAIPTSQCMSCHMHQPNMFMNTYMGYTMWDYESDAPFMWPEKQKYPTHAEIHEANERNPEGAAVLGKWIDPEFLDKVSELNPQLNDTQFADYHGHGWNFRAIFKRDRDGNLLDAEGDIVADTDPKKFDKAVHMSSIHLDAGMHCVDCHFAQDSHGNGHIYGEVANAVEIDCVDCHGTATQYPKLVTSGPAALVNPTDLSILRNPDGKLRFEWINGKLIQRSLVDKGLEWEVSLVKDSVDKNHADYNEKAARAKLMSKNTDSLAFGHDVSEADLAHPNNDMECYTCHTSWTTSCGGCHLPIKANRKTERLHYEGGESRNYATYNPQVARDQLFMLGRRGEINGGRIAPVRSTSALILSSTNSNRERIYIQQPPVAASGYSSQAINPHFPHTVRKTETKTCSDCHLSEVKDNNAIMTQLFGFGTKFIDFVGFHAWVGTGENVTAVQVTEWEEPQAVIGSYLQRYAYPDFYQKHQDEGRELQIAHTHGTGDAARCIQLRGEYLYVAQGTAGVQVYDVASIGNKGFSQKIITAPFSKIGHNAHIDTKNATCLVMSTTQPVHPDRNKGDLMRIANQEKPFHPIYSYAFVTDSEEGLILFDNNTFSDGEFRNNFIERAVTWNENGILNGAEHISMAGFYAYIAADAGIVVVSLDNPLEPKLVSVIPLEDTRASFVQFRYLFVTDKDGLKVVDITNPAKPVVTGNTIALEDAQKVFVARTFAYVAAGKQGLVIVDAKKPEQMVVHKVVSEGVKDARDVVVATTNASLFAYVADGVDGLKVVQLTAPDTQPKFYGFSPAPEPRLIAHYPTEYPALSLSRALERDRAVDETGGQVSVFGRLGAGPLTTDDIRRMYLNDQGKPWYVTDEVKK